VCTFLKPLKMTDNAALFATIKKSSLKGRLTPLRVGEKGVFENRAPWRAICGVFWRGVFRVFLTIISPSFSP
jgi:hypothetical protein